MKYLLLILSSLLFVGCSTTSNHMSDTMDIIEAAADLAPEGVPGNYRFYIQATGMQPSGKRVFLNTELDYRDQRNITITLAPNVVLDFYAQQGTSPISFYKGKTIEVVGEAKRVKIYFISNGRRSSKYYYQTQIAVTDLSQLKVIDESR